MSSSRDHSNENANKNGRKRNIPGSKNKKSTLAQTVTPMEVSDNDSIAASLGPEDSMYSGTDATPALKVNTMPVRVVETSENEVSEPAGEMKTEAEEKTLVVTEQSQSVCMISCAAEIQLKMEIDTQTLRIKEQKALELQRKVEEERLILEKIQSEAGLKGTVENEELRMNQIDPEKVGEPEADAEPETDLEISTSSILLNPSPMSANFNTDQVEFHTDEQQEGSDGTFLILECQIPDTIEMYSSDVEASGGSSKSRSFTVMHEGRYYEVHTPPDGQPGEIINVIVLPSSTMHSMENISVGLFSPSSSTQSTPVTLCYSGRYLRSSVGCSSSASPGQSLRAALQTKLFDVLTKVNDRCRITETVSNVSESAFNRLKNLNDKFLFQSTTLFDWLEEIVYICRKKLGTLVSIALQVEQEFKIGQTVQARAVEIRDLLEPYLMHACLHLQEVDSRFMGGRISRIVAHLASALIPPAMLQQMPQYLIPAAAQEEEEEVAMTARKEKVLALNYNPRSVRAALVGHSTAPMSEIKHARVIQTPLRVKLRQVSPFMSPTP